MNIKTYFVLLLLLPIIGLSACGSAQSTTIVPTPTATFKPSPTRMPLPPAVTPTIAEPTSTNTPVVIASYTPKPPTDTPTPRPTATETPTPVATEEEPSIETSSSTVKIDWVDTDGKPSILMGEDEGLYIWTEGDRVHLRGITKGDKYTFQGQAIGHGAIVNIDTFGEDINVTVGDDVSRVGFEWNTIGGPEGLDFSFSGGNLLLNLSITGIPEPEPNLVFVGPDKQQAGMSVEFVR